VHMKQLLDFFGGVGFNPPADCESRAMSSLDEEQMAEIAESLRVSGEAELRWSRLVSKFHRRSHLPAATDELGGVRRFVLEPPSAS
jgi:hypothetical protein